MEIGQGISHKGLYVEDWQFPFYLASGITVSDVGKAVALDTSAAHKVKLAGDGDPIIGRLEVVENRVTEGVLVGTVALAGGMEFPVKSGETVNIGDTVQGAGSGEVKARAVSTDTDGTGSPAIRLASHNVRNIVVATRTGFCTAIVK